MAPWFDPDYDAALHYEALKGERTCWACYADQRPRSPYYWGPWIIERAHMVNKPRREDARLVVMLCTICHKISHGERFSGFNRPKLDLDHLLAIKWGGTRNGSTWLSCKSIPFGSCLRSLTRSLWNI